MGSETNGKNPTGKRKSSARFNDVTFINWSLSAEQKAVIKAWVPSVEDIDNAESEIIQESCKITRSYDDFSSCYTCSIVPTSKHKTNYGYILVGKGSTPLKAFKQVVYIHKQVFAGDWSSYSTGSRNEELDD